MHLKLLTVKKQDQVITIGKHDYFTPPEFDKQVRQARTVAFLKWGKCDDCSSWVHLKYCSSVTEIEAGVPFKCKDCDLN